MGAFLRQHNYCRFAPRNALFTITILFLENLVFCPFQNLVLDDPLLLVINIFIASYAVEMYIL